MVVRPSLLALLVLTACSQPAPYVLVPRPAGLERAPRQSRDGHVFYWVTDRWYVQNGGQWYAYPPPIQPMDTWAWRR